MAERAKFMVQMKEEETRALIIKAEADSEAAQLVADAISKYGTGLVLLRKIEAAQYMVEQL